MGGIILVVPLLDELYMNHQDSSFIIFIACQFKVFISFSHCSKKWSIHLPGERC